MITFHQFPVILTYTITDYKCQSQIFALVIVDLKKPSGHAPAASPYVQLSRAKTRESLSILRPFDPAELQSALSKHVLMELHWQTEKAKETDALHMYWLI